VCDSIPLIPVTVGQTRPIVSVPFKTIHHHEQLHHLANLFSGLPKQSLDCWNDKWSNSREWEVLDLC